MYTARVCCVYLYEYFLSCFGRSCIELVTAAIINHVNACHNSIAKHDYEFDMNAFLCERKTQAQCTTSRQAGNNYNSENDTSGGKNNKTIHMKI